MSVRCARVRATSSKLPVGADFKPVWVDDSVGHRVSGASSWRVVPQLGRFALRHNVLVAAKANGADGKWA